MLHIFFLPCACFSPIFYIASHYIHSLSYPTWGVNNIPALFCSLSSARIFKTLMAFCRRNTEGPELLFAVTGRSTKISRNNNDIVRCNISYRLIFFNFLSTHSSPHFYNTYLNQEHKTIKDLQWGAWLTLSEEKRKGRIHLHTYMYHTNQIIDQSHQSETAWSWVT